MADDASGDKRGREGERKDIPQGSAAKGKNATASDTALATSCTALSVAVAAISAR